MKANWLIQKFRSPGKLFWLNLKNYPISRSRKKHVFDLFVILTFDFISCPKFFQCIFPFDHEKIKDVCSVFRNFPHLLCMPSLEFISFPHHFFHCTIRFCDFFVSPVTRIYPSPPLLLHVIIGVHQFYVFMPWFYHWISISFPNLFVSFQIRFYQ